MNAVRVASHIRRGAPVPSRRGLLRTFVAAGLGLRPGPDATAGRKRCKKRRGKPVAPATCAQSCPAGCSTCYLRPSGPVLCGGAGSADCAVACSSDNDCLETFRPYCTHTFIDRATGETSSWGCPGNPDGVCTNIAACEG